jgi:hypothetical protein
VQLLRYKSYMTHTRFRVHGDEKVLMKLRKHWFVFFRQAIGIVLTGILPIIVASAFLASDGISNSTVALFIFFASLWLLASWIGLMVVWTNHYLDVWVITDRRIIYAEQIHLFVREVSTMSLARVQDATERYNNFIETVLGFGSLRVQSAGPVENEITMHGIPQPGAVKQFVLRQVDRYTPMAHEPANLASAKDILKGK